MPRFAPASAVEFVEHAELFIEQRVTRQHRLAVQVRAGPRHALDKAFGRLVGVDNFLDVPRMRFGVLHARLADGPCELASAVATFVVGVGVDGVGWIAVLGGVVPSVEWTHVVGDARAHELFQEVFVFEQEGIVLALFIDDGVHFLQVELVGNGAVGARLLLGKKLAVVGIEAILDVLESLVFLQLGAALAERADVLDEVFLRAALAVGKRFARDVSAVAACGQLVDVIVAVLVLGATEETVVLFGEVIFDKPLEILEVMCVLFVGVDHGGREARLAAEKVGENIGGVGRLQRLKEGKSVFGADGEEFFDLLVVGKFEIASFLLFETGKNVGVFNFVSDAGAADGLSHVAVA